MYLYNNLLRTRHTEQCHHSCAADWQHSQFDYIRSAGNWFPVGGIPVLSVRLWDNNSHLSMAKWQQGSSCKAIGS